MAMALKYINLLMLATWLGGMIFFSFIDAPAIFNTLPKDLAGQLVGVIFPKYWILGYAGSLILLGTFYLIARNHLAEMKPALIILALLVPLSFTQGLIVGQKAATIKQEIKQTSDETKVSALRKSFGRIHGVSSVLNIATLILLLAYLYHIPALMRL
jgi:hypothetical protein